MAAPWKEKPIKIILEGWHSNEKQNRKQIVECPDGRNRRITNTGTAVRQLKGTRKEQMIKKAEEVVTSQREKGTNDKMLQSRVVDPDPDWIQIQ
jgi:ribosomal protein S3AE